MKIFLAFVLGALLAAGVIWIMSDPVAKQEVKELGNDIGDGMTKAGHEIRDAVDNVDTAEMKKNLKEAGRQVADKTKEVVSDATITASIKAKLAASSEVSAFSIDVDTTDGLVTLSGKVSSPHEIKRATEIASSVEGVKQVISTLQVKTESATPSPAHPES